MNFKWFLISVFLITPSVYPQTTSDTPQSLAALLSPDREVEILEASEFTISFPHNEDPAIEKFLAKADHKKYQGSAFTHKKQIKAGTLESAEYRDLIDHFRQLNESGFRQTAAETMCREPYHVKIRVGTNSRTFAGCRDGSSNAGVVSRISRDLEFLLIKNEVKN